jgi:hypothetical protein
MGRTAQHLAILLLSAAPVATRPALAQSQPGRGLDTFTPIQCAGASDLCAWKRIPDAGAWQGFEARPTRRIRRPGLTPR